MLFGAISSIYVLRIELFIVFRLSIMVCRSLLNRRSFCSSFCNGFHRRFDAISQSPSILCKHRKMTIIFPNANVLGPNLKLLRSPAPSGSHLSLSKKHPRKYTGARFTKGTEVMKTDPRSCVHICIYARICSYMRAYIHIC